MSEPRVEQIVLASRPEGLPVPANFRLEKVVIPAMPAGGTLLRVLYLSLDPYMRGRMDDRKSYAKPLDIGDVMTGESVCEVIASDRQDYAAGDIVLAPTGWRTHAAIEGSVPMRKFDSKLALISTGLGVLGMPRFTAYAGLSIIGKPKRGETVVVAAASGPVGSLEVGWSARGRHRRRGGKVPLRSRRVTLRRLH
jgi:NADPH-dependent curcumin reductase